VNTGDVVTYTVTVRNDGAGDYTATAPAVAQDDLTAVIDDATYNADATASVGTVSYASPILRWTSPLAAGDTATFEYTVTVTNAGDHVLENTAGPVCTSPEICDPPVTVTTPLPHITPSKSSDPASGAALQAGDVVTYTLSWTNDGEAAGPVDSTDDLSNVLDDAEVTAEPVSSDPAVTAVRSGDEIRVTGTIQPDQTITVVYEATIKPDGARGDNIAENVLTPDAPPQLCADGDADCDPFVPPSTTHPIGELDDWKLVNPSSGSTVQAGQQVVYTLHFENIGEADVDVDRDDVLTQVLDDATMTSDPVSSDPALSLSPIDDGRFTVSGTLTPGQHVTVTYTVTVNADGERGDDRLGNALVPTGTDPDPECAPIDPDRPDCTVNNVSAVVASKSADPASGSEVGQGQRVTYTLSFENVSANPDAAAAPIDYTDYLDGVLDDAVVTTEPSSSDDGVTAVRDGRTIRVTGAVATGDTVTVTYAVTVNAYGEQGDHRLGNILAVTGDAPACVPDSHLCTEHDLVPPPPLAITGGTVAWGAALGAIVLMLAGGGLLIARRRRVVAVLPDGDRSAR
jgi:fimbrial isopeptide formation D2 family protein